MSHPSVDGDFPTTPEVTGQALPVNRVSFRDPRLARLTAFVARVEGAARGLARLTTVAALAGAGGGLALWWSTSGRGIADVGPETAGSLVLLALCLAPAGWLLNVRHSLLALLTLPEKLGDVTVRRGTQLVGAATREPPAHGSAAGHRAGGWAAIGSLRGVVRDYGDVVGSWATVTQLVTPSFWALTAAALLAVPILLALAAVTGLVAAFT